MGWDLQSHGNDCSSGAPGSQPLVQSCFRIFFPLGDKGIWGNLWKTQLSFFLLLHLGAEGKRRKASRTIISQQLLVSKVSVEGSRFPALR